MNLDRFLRERQEAWEELERLLSKAGRRPDRSPPSDVLRLGQLYREAAADLSLARRRFAHDPVRSRLEALVGAARSAVYDVEPRRMSLLDWVTTGYWHRIAERPVVLALAGAMLLLPALLGAMWALQDPAQAVGFLPEEFRSVTQARPEGADLGLGVEARTVLSTVIFTNNIRVTFLAFAGGVILGLGTVYVVVFNGALLGTVTGLAFTGESGLTFVELVIPHGVLELSCIVVAAAAGLRLGWSLVDPGDRKRSDAVVDEGRAAVEIILGTAAWLVLAGLVEGFITPAGYGLSTALAIGVGLGVAFWLLVWWRGVLVPRRPRVSGDAQSRARVLARR